LIVNLMAVKGIALQEFDAFLECIGSFSVNKYESESEKRRN